MKASFQQPIPSTETTDEQLVQLSLAGDSNAFGRIVERYQSLVCSLALSACGDVQRSEDIAQESFLVGWRQLRDLREPAKFRSWICGIARNVANNALRKEKRTPTDQAVAWEEGGIEPGESTTPADRAISREEESILLRQLEELPHLYREPMVLFYREQESVAAVALALGISEDAAKQRLSRGRAMLAERVERSLGRVLRATAPKAAFTAAVMGALAAATTAQASAASASLAAGMSANAAKGAKGANAVNGAAAGGGFLSAFSLSIAAFLVGLWNVFKGVKESTRSPRERRFAGKAMAVGWSCALVFGLLCPLLLVYSSREVSLSLSLRGQQLFACHWTPCRPCYVVLCAAVLGVLGMLSLGGFFMWADCRQRRIRAEEGRGNAGIFLCVAPDQPGFRKAILGLILSMGVAYNIAYIETWAVLRGTFWMPAAYLLPLLISLLTAGALLRHPLQFRLVLTTQWIALWLQSLLLMGVCWHKWAQSGRWAMHREDLAFQVFVLAVFTVFTSLAPVYWRWQRSMAALQQTGKD